MTRFDDWASRLYGYLAETADIPFDWGKHDCALFAAGAVLAMTGHDISGGARDQYSDHASGVRWLARTHGAGGMVDWFARHFPEVHPFSAGVGDLVVIDDEGGSGCMGVVIGAMARVLRPEGWGMVPITEARRAFRV